MEIFATILVIVLLLVAAATVSALLRDGRGHTPPVASHQAWSALDLPSTNYTLRIFYQPPTPARNPPHRPGPSDEPQLPQRQCGTGAGGPPQ